MSEALARLSRSVSAQLRANPRVQIVAGEGIDLYVAQQFLSVEECHALIAMIDADRQPSQILAVQPEDKSFRNSESCNMDRWHPFVQTVDTRICDLVGIDPRMGETMQGQRYSVGQQFKAHQDYFHVDQPYWKIEEGRGGQRSWTCMIYLDEPAGGGQTLFEQARLQVAPRTGMLLAWNNMNDDGSPNAQSMHESLPVTAGIKNIVTKWFREANWV